MAHLTKAVVTLAGVLPSFVAAAGGGDTFDPDADTMVVVKNGGGSPVTVTIATPKVDPKTGLAEADAGGSVPAGSERWFGPFPYETFADPANQGRASIAYSGVTTVTTAVVGLPRLS